MTDSSCTHSILTTVLFSKSLPQLLHGQPATISAAVCSPLCVALNSKTRNLRDCGGEIRFRVSTNHTNSLQLKPEGKIAKANNILCTLQVILQLEMFLSLYQIRQPEDYLLFAYMDSFTFNFFFLRFLFCLFLKNSNTFQKLFSLPQLGCSKSYFWLQKSIDEPQTPHYTVISTDINIHHIAIHIHGI